MARMKTKGSAVPDPIAAPVPAVDIQPAEPAPEPAAEKPVLAKLLAAVAIPTSAAQVRTAFSHTEDAKMDTIETATEKTQAMFAGLNDRTKGAVEKSTQMFEEMNAFGKGNVEAIVESSKLAAKALETVGQDVAEYAKTSFESSTAAMKTLASASSPTEFFKLQGDYARAAFDAMIAQSSRSTEKLLKMAGEVAQPISNRVAVATDKFKTAA